jgi:hypothetical protein
MGSSSFLSRASSIKEMSYSDGEPAIDFETFAAVLRDAELLKPPEPVCRETPVFS